MKVDDGLWRTALARSSEVDLQVAQVRGIGFELRTPAGRDSDAGRDVVIHHTDPYPCPESYVGA